MQNSQSGGSGHPGAYLKGLRRLHNACADSGGVLPPLVPGFIGKGGKARNFRNRQRMLTAGYVEAVVRGIVDLYGNLLLRRLPDKGHAVNLNIAAFDEFKRRVLKLRIKQRRELHPGGVIGGNRCDNARRDER